MVKTISAVSPARALLAALASGSLFLAGCSSSMAPTESLATGGHSSAQIAGKIHGGNQPVSGAVVTLYSASQTSFASGATPIAHTTSAADGYGSFAFQASTSSPNDNSGNTYFCDPNGTNPFYYLVARGGTTVNTPDAHANPSAVFIAPLGRCQSVDASTFVNMSEVVTVATMAAMHQFMNPSAAGGIENSVGSDGILTSDQGLGNAFYSVSNMVNLSTGLANPSLSRSSIGVTITVTPEAAKINQLANALSACINFSGSGNPNCATLFSNAAPPSDTSYTSVPGADMPTATDPLVALYYIFTNPTNASTAGGDGFTNRKNLFNLSGGAGAPYQPTLASVPTDWTIGVGYTSVGTCTDVPNSAANFLNNPASLSIDRFGSVYFSNMQAGTASLASLTGTGLPGSCTTLTSTSGTPGGSMASVVDSNDNVYAAVLGTTDAYSYNPIDPTQAPVHFTTPAAVLGLTADGNGNIFFSTTDGKLYEGTPSTLSYTLISSSLDNAGGATSLQVDPVGRIWASGSPTTVTVPDGSSTTGYTTSQAPSQLLALKSLTLGRSNGFYITRYATDGVSLEFYDFENNTSGQPSALAHDAVQGNGLVAPVSLAVDGSQNIWAANSSGSITGFSSRLSFSLAPNGFVKDPSYFGAERAISIDTAGNIWVASGSNTITEVVGAAVPVVKSYATALRDGRFQQLP